MCTLFVTLKFGLLFWIDRLYLYNWLRITYIMFKETYLNCSIVLQMHLSYFSFQPVLHDWCNKGCGMCYPVYGMVHIKEPLLLIGKNSPYGGSRYPLTIPPLPKKKEGNKRIFLISLIFLFRLSVSAFCVECIVK